MRLLVRVFGVTLLEVEADDGAPPDMNEPTEPWPFGFTAGAALAHTEIAPADCTEVTA